jgi:predicted RNA-binding Zn-ribbon protein involved in translation (DUF1610 family)
MKRITALFTFTGGDVKSMLLQIFGNQRIKSYFCFVKIEITLYCPDCQSPNIKRNGKKSSKKQNYLCKDCGRQFIGNHALSYKPEFDLRSPIILT